MTTRRKEVTDQEKLEIEKYREYAERNGTNFYEMPHKAIDEKDYEDEGEWSLISDPTF